MRHEGTLLRLCLLLLSFGLLTSPAAAELYWCPHKLGGVYQDYPEPGCTPLGENKQKEATPGAVTPSHVPSAENLERALESLAQDYQHLLARGLSGEEARQQIESLERRVAELLDQTQGQLSRNKLYQLNGRGLLLAITRLNNEIQSLKPHVGERKTATIHDPALDVDQGASERRRIQDSEEWLQRKPEGGHPPSGARTGQDIGMTPTTGERIGASGRSGDDVGTTPTVGRDIGSTPAFGPDIGVTPRTGPEIGATPQAGPASGDADLTRLP